MMAATTVIAQEAGAPPTDEVEAQEPQVTAEAISGTPPEPLPDDLPEAAEDGKGAEPSLRSEDPIAFDRKPLPPLPEPLRGAFIAAQGGQVVVAGGRTDDGVSADIYLLQTPAGGEPIWEKVGVLQTPRAFGAAASGTTGIELIGGETDAGPVALATRLVVTPEGVEEQPLPDLPMPVSRPTTARRFEGKLFVVAGGRQFLSLETPEGDSAYWQTRDPWPEGDVSAPVMVEALDSLYLFTGRESEVDPASLTFRWRPHLGWTQYATADNWPAHAAAAQVGPSHVFVFGGSDSILAYHTITDTWFDAGTLEQGVGPNPTAVTVGERIVLLGQDGALDIEPLPLTPYFPWVDYAVVALYLVGMVAIGWYFIFRERSTEDYFRGGRHVPWWATGMSLFATGASAISLMAMPGKSYQANWEYFSISIFSLLALPVSMFVLAPLVRRLNISTANEYLERRFGLVARLFASIIYIFSHVATRFAAIMLLPALAFNAITGVDVIWGIVLMGLVTTLYVYLGGLEAVIWTDTVQGFIMCGAVAGCLILALSRVGDLGGAIDTTYGLGKLNVFDLDPSLLRVTSLAFLINTLIVTFGAISDQNYVQRVQATPTLGDAQRAVATQLAVAVPINVLLFGLGTALWLFYRSQPEKLSPAMDTDSVFPFFVAQQLPVGLSGLVMAALLAATMSTISSTICAVSDLGVNDFYRRFSRHATDQSSLIVGRVLIAVIGVVGTVVAIGLSMIESKSVWDLAILLAGLITNGIIGLFWLGLLTRRANQLGAMIGVLVGMLTVLLLRMETQVTFLVYQAVGAVVAVVVGYVASLLLPFGRRDTTGLTVFSVVQPEKATT